MSNNIDKIIYINLNHRQDKKDRIEAHLHEYNLPFERFEAIHYPNFPCYGCGCSHLQVLKLAKQQQYKNVLILEDDFAFNVDKNTLESQLQEFFNYIKTNQITWDVCKLSYNLQHFQHIDNCVVNKTLCSQAASGYLVNSSYYDKLIDLYEKALPLLLETSQHWIYANDIVWKQLQLSDNWFHFKTRLGIQLNGLSDISNVFVDNTVWQK